MDHLLAKTKGSNGEYFKVVSDQNIFVLPDNLDNDYEFTPTYKLEEDEWFSIDDFSEQDFFDRFLGERFVSAEYNQLPVNQYQNINHLCAYQSGKYFIQKLSPRQILRKSKYFTISQQPTLNTQPIIVIDPIPDAIYIKRQDKLYFKNLGTLTTVFKGIEVLYREATQEETATFLSNDFISLEDGYSADNVKTMNRKRIAHAAETLGQFSPMERQNIFSYIRDYCPTLAFNEEDENFSLSSEEDLKQLLYGIEQRYYTTLVGNQKRLANSVKDL